MRLHTFAVAVSLLAGCASAKAGPDAPTVSGPHVRTTKDVASVVEALAQIARRGLAGDPAAIEQRLHLEGMMAGPAWEPPPERDRGAGDRTSYEAAAESPISRVFLRRRERYVDYSMDSLSVIFKEGRCPTFETAEAAFGMKLDVWMNPQGHGDLPPYPFRSLDLIADDGRSILVGVEDEGCHIWMSRPCAADDSGGG